MRIYVARHLLPVSAPPIVDGALAIESGRIVDLGRRADVLADAPAECEIRDLGDEILLPGLVNGLLD